MLSLANVLDYKGEKKSNACTGAGFTTGYTILWLKDKFPHNTSKLPTLNPYFGIAVKKKLSFCREEGEF